MNNNNNNSSDNDVMYQTPPRKGVLGRRTTTNGKDVNSTNNDKDSSMSRMTRQRQQQEHVVLVTPAVSSVEKLSLPLRRASSTTTKRQRTNVDQEEEGVALSSSSASSSNKKRIRRTILLPPSPPSNGSSNNDLSSVVAAVTPSPSQRLLTTTTSTSSTTKKVCRNILPKDDSLSSKQEQTITTPSETNNSGVSAVVSVITRSTPQRDLSSEEDDEVTVATVTTTTSSKRFQQKVALKESTKQVYKIVQRCTGSIGGNGCGGAIYGETTAVSLQRIIELMKRHTHFSSSSRFIDVGCGLGKPNLHVCQDPGVSFSYGIEMEEVRYMLGLHNVLHVLKEAKKHSSSSSANKVLGTNCILDYGNIIQAKTFDPFTHVYMFDIGFPPTLFHQLADMFNNSLSNYLISYQPPSRIIDCYEFDVKLVARDSISMHGSKEHHTGYIYERTSLKTTPDDNDVPCDALFQQAWNHVRRGDLNHLSKVIETKYKQVMNTTSCHDESTHDDTTTTTSRSRRTSNRRRSPPIRHC